MRVTKPNQNRSEDQNGQQCPKLPMILIVLNKTRAFNNIEEREIPETKSYVRETSLYDRPLLMIHHSVIARMKKISRSARAFE